MGEDDLNVLVVQLNGPSVVTGDLAVALPSRVRTMKTAVLCRCGHSSDKPFCDGAHVKAGFRDTACLHAGVESASMKAGRVTITPLHNGPLRCDGPLSIRVRDRHVFVTDSILLCRCGGSLNKPFCDGTHGAIGFIA
jgi:CDGSH-type Zn-finger protein